MIFAVIVFIFTALASLIKFIIKLTANKQPQPNQTLEILPQHQVAGFVIPAKPVRYITEKQNDQSIIDIDQNTTPIHFEKEPLLKKYSPGVPAWTHHYVYSANEINYAGPEQRAFYAFFKKSFLAGDYIDLEGNTNYGFILYFDLLKEYQGHKNLPLLQKQLANLEISCQRTASYARSFILGEMRRLGDADGINRLESQWTNVNTPRPDYLNWDWRTIYEKKMNLTKEEAEMLSHIWLSSSAFMNIEFCRKQVIRLYLEMVKELRKAYTQAGTSTEKEFPIILDVIARKQNRYHLNSPNYNYVITHDDPLYMYLTRYGENLLRDIYGNTRKINLETYYNQEQVKLILQERIFNYLEPKIPAILERLEPLDEASEIELNAGNPARWRNQVAEVFGNHNSDECLLKLENIVRLNIKNPSLDLLFYDLSRNLTTINKTQSLVYYFKHLHFALEHKKVFKLLTAAQRKQLFATPEQTLLFTTYVNDFIKAPNLDLESAIKYAMDFYKTVRKKIVLDTSSIELAESQDSLTTERLAQYLSEDDDVPIIADHDEITPETTKLIRTASYQIQLNPAADRLLEFFKEKEFILSTESVDAFCKNEGMMPGSLINNINESCYDLLDDLLIENSDDNYTVNKNYYHQIINT